MPILINFTQRFVEIHFRKITVAHKQQITSAFTTMQQVQWHSNKKIISSRYQQSTQVLSRLTSMDRQLKSWRKAWTKSSHGMKGMRHCWANSYAMGKEKKAQKQVVGLLTILPTGSVSTWPAQLAFQQIIYACFRHCTEVVTNLPDNAHQYAHLSGGRKLYSNNKSAPFVSGAVCP